MEKAYTEVLLYKYLQSNKIPTLHPKILTLYYNITKLLTLDVMSVKRVQFTKCKDSHNLWIKILKSNTCNLL